ncbi:MAG TPA: lytic transglycosylase domain-containing protein, partial [Mycobacteriales bacterium]|nr:lytic transglycosylase domain-containing protein [Mycobacteriales bacterium]
MRHLARLRRATTTVVAAALIAVFAPVVSAGADTGAQADAKVKQILAQVQKIRQQVATAEHSYDQALAGVADSVNAQIQSGRVSDGIAAQAAAAQKQLDDRVRGLYMSGGPLAIYATLLDAQDPSALQEQAIIVGQVVSGDRVAANAAEGVSQQAAAIAAAATRQAQVHIRTERSVAVVASRVLGLLAQEQALLDQAQQHAADVHAAEQALAAEQAQLSAITQQRIAALRPLPAPAAYMALYHRGAAAECPGLSWTVLAAIGQVESGHGRDTSTSYAGAMGPMQFLPETFDAYAVDGDNDGVADIMDPADAIYTAANYLCANGANRGPDAL